MIDEQHIPLWWIKWLVNTRKSFDFVNKFYLGNDSNHSCLDHTHSLMNHYSNYTFCNTNMYGECHKQSIIVNYMSNCFKYKKDEQSKPTKQGIGSWIYHIKWWGTSCNGEQRRKHIFIHTLWSFISNVQTQLNLHVLYLVYKHCIVLKLIFSKKSYADNYTM